MFGMIEKSTNQNMVLAEAPSKLMPAGPGSKPPPDSKEELRKTKICQKLTPNATIFAGGAQAWSTVIKEEWPRCRVEQCKPQRWPIYENCPKWIQRITRSRNTGH